MSVLINILPHSNGLEINGESDPSSAYSLSGNVAVTIESSSSLFSCRRTTRLLLQSLVITFEGKSELVFPRIGYSSYRICSIAKELAPQKPVELSNEGCENSDRPCTWNVIFNLRIPGWLPSSTVFGSYNGVPVGTRYLLRATAKIVMIDEPLGCRLLSTIFNPRATGPKIVRAPEHYIAINRVVVAPSSSRIPYRTFCVEAQDQGACAIPTSVLSKIQIMISVPQHIDVNDDSFQLRLRLRAHNLGAMHCQRLSLKRFSVDILQQETYRARPSDAYLARYPVPSETSQPLERVQSLRDYPLDHSADRTFSVMPYSSRSYQLCGDGYIFTAESEDDSSCTWYAMEPLIPFVRETETGNKMKRDWGRTVLRCSGTSPLFVVRHLLYLSMDYAYDVEGDQTQRTMATLRLAIPIHFGEVREHDEVVNCATASSGSWDSLNESPSTLYYLPNNLPDYSQLFDSNGERKESDYSLPIYTATCSSASMSTLEFAEYRASIDI